MAAYKVAAEAGNAACQWQVGFLYYEGRGVDVDYAQALPWIEKAAAQDQPDGVAQLGVMYHEGKGVASSWRRAREYYEKAVQLGCEQAAKNMRSFSGGKKTVTGADGRLHSAFPLRVRGLALPPPRTDTLPSRHARSALPSWTSGWRSTARAVRT